MTYKLDNDKTGHVRLYDLTGKMVFRTTLVAGEGKVEINVADLKDGVYLFRVTSGEKTIAQDKLVIIK